MREKRRQKWKIEEENERNNNERVNWWMNAMSKHTQREREGEKGKMDCKGIKKNSTKWETGMRANDSRREQQKLAKSSITVIESVSVLKIT